MKSKKTITYLLSTIIMFVALISTATYAFFSANVSRTNSVVVNANTAGSSYTLTTYSSSNVELSLTASMMLQTVSSTSSVLNANGTISVNLQSPSTSSETTCTYDVVWVWDSTGTNAYTETSLIPYTDTSVTPNVSYPYQFSIKVSSSLADAAYTERDIAGLTDVKEKDLGTFTYTTVNSKEQTTLLANESITSTSPTGVSNIYKVELNMYNLPVQQDDLLNKKFKGHVEIVTGEDECTITSV